MSTSTQAAPARQRTPVQCVLVCRPTFAAAGRLLINGKPYSYRRLRPSPGSGCLSLTRLAKLDGSTVVETYDLALLVGGREDCSCGDFTFRGAQEGRRCKHLTAADQLGLLTLPTEAAAIYRTALERIAAKCGPHAAGIAREALAEAEIGTTQAEADAQLQLAADEF